MAIYNLNILTLLTSFTLFISCDIFELLGVFTKKVSFSEDNHCVFSKNIVWFPHCGARNWMHTNQLYFSGFTGNFLYIRSHFQTQLCLDMFQIHIRIFVSADLIKIKLRASFSSLANSMIVVAEATLPLSEVFYVAKCVWFLVHRLFWLWGQCSSLFTGPWPHPT